MTALPQDPGFFCLWFGLEIIQGRERERESVSSRGSVSVNLNQNYAVATI